MTHGGAHDDYPFLKVFVGDCMRITVHYKFKSFTELMHYIAGVVYTNDMMRDAPNTTTTS